MKYKNTVKRCNLFFHRKHHTNSFSITPVSRCT